MAIPVPTVDDFTESTVMQECRRIVEYIIDTLIPAINEGGGGSSYVLPPATKSTLGGIIVGDNLTVDGSGKVNAPAPYTLPIGGRNIGGVKNGGNVTIDAQGNMNAPTTPAYTLPVASPTTLGGVKIGNGVSVGADGTISVNSSSATELGLLNVFPTNTINNSTLRSWIQAHPDSILFISGYVSDQNSGYMKLAIYTKPLTSDPENKKHTTGTYYQCWGENWVSSSNAPQTITRLFDDGSIIFGLVPNTNGGSQVASPIGSGFRITVN